MAEGVGRVLEKDRAHFIEIAYGSLVEVNCQLGVSSSLEYTTADDFLEIDSLRVVLPESALREGG